MGEKARVHLFVRGLVQGVAFRAHTIDEARRLRLHGWVRNVPDGRVEVEAEGERESLERLVEFCRRGPPAASVDGVDADWGAYRGDLGPFGARF